MVVIDFEYAAANLPALEFANHFVSHPDEAPSQRIQRSDAPNSQQTEWCYDYRDAGRAYALRHFRYPTPEEQRQFIRSYIEHVGGDTSPTPGDARFIGRAESNSSVSGFMLDNRTPAGQLLEEEASRSQDLEAEIERLMLETRLWRVANSAQWVAWGVIQATIPDMADCDNTGRAVPSSSATLPTERETSPKGLNHGRHGGTDCRREAPTSRDGQQQQQQRSGDVTAADPSSFSIDAEVDCEIDDGFDYLGYAQERAMLFWGDVLQLGIVSKSDLPADLLPKLKIIKY